MKNNKPKILLWDIETRPTEAYIWSLWQDNIPINMIQREGSILMWAAKWLGDKKVMYSTIQDGETICLSKIWKLLDEADVIIAHNGNSFDTKVMNGYFLRANIDPPSPSLSIDTLKVARNRFKILSNKLDYLGTYLNLGNKTPHSGFALWKGCMANEKKSWDNMIKYNIQDVNLLEKVYYRLLPWIKNHPNYGNFVNAESPMCRNCGSTKLHKKGIEYTNVGQYQRYKCIKCHTPLRGRLKINNTNYNILN